VREVSGGYRGRVPHHLEPAPNGPLGYEDRSSDDFDPDDLEPEDWSEPIPPPIWWRWVALIVVLAMVVATPFAYALYLLLN
jgi:hypothetical protein